MKFFDCYAYLGLIHSDPIERFRVIQEAKRANVTHIVNICNTVHDFEQIYESMSNIPQVLYAVGYAPGEAQNLPSDWYARMEKAMSLKNIVAVGPVGLDYNKKIGNPINQIDLFIKQLHIARKFNKPVISYDREAGEDIKNILLQNAPSAGVIFHCYSESSDYAHTCLQDFDFPTFFSFAGNITFKNSREIHKTILQIPCEHILVESASPFLPPSLFTGVKNVPSHVFSVVEFIAELLNIEFEVCSNILYENALRAFSIANG